MVRSSALTPKTKSVFADDHRPFASIDQTGVGQLIEIAAAKGNKTRPGIKFGICGEHGGEQARPARTL